jgi:hypothetical protein
LQIYARDVDATRATLTLFYSKNGGSNINVPGATGTQLPATCSFIYTITGLTVGDSIEFGTSVSAVMNGNGSSSSCPFSSGSATTYTYVIDAPSIQQVGITIDSGVLPPSPTPTPTAAPGIGFGLYTGATFGTSGGACADTNYPSITRYLNADSVPNVGDYFYNTVDCTPGDTYVGNGNWYNVRKNSNKWAIQIGATGQILGVVDCNVTPTPTPIPPTPTPTPTSTPPAFLTEFTISKGNAGSSGSGTACANYPTTNPYTVYNVAGYLSEGDTVYSDALGTTPFAGGPGSGFYYSDGTEYGRINNSGIYTKMINLYL